MQEDTNKGEYMTWNTICVEGFCSGENVEKKYPCGKTSPSCFCLENHICPHFAYAESDEREVSWFVPFKLLLKDRIESWANDIWWKIRYNLWDILWFNRRKTNKFFNNIRSISSEECPALKEFEDREKENEDRFPEWFKKAKEDNAWKNF